MINIVSDNNFNHLTKVIQRQAAVYNNLNQYAQPLAEATSSIQPQIDNIQQIQNAYSVAVKPYIQLANQYESTIKQATAISKQIEASIAPYTKLVESYKQSFEPLISSYTSILNSIEPVYTNVLNSAQVAEILNSIKANPDIYETLNSYNQALVDEELPNTDEWLETEITDDKISVGKRFSVETEEIENFSSELENIESEEDFKEIQEEYADKKNVVSISIFFSIVFPGILLFISKEIDSTTFLELVAFSEFLYKLFKFFENGNID